MNEKIELKLSMRFEGVASFNGRFGLLHIANNNESLNQCYFPTEMENLNRYTHYSQMIFQH